MVKQVKIGQVWVEKKGVRRRFSVRYTYWLEDAFGDRRKYVRLETLDRKKETRMQVSNLHRNYKLVHNLVAERL